MPVEYKGYLYACVDVGYHLANEKLNQMLTTTEHVLSCCYYS